MVFVNPVRMRPVRILLALALVACSIGCNDPVTSPSGFAAYSQTDLLVGTGAEAGTGQLLSVRYTGWLFDRNASDSKGIQFDAAQGKLRWDNREPVAAELKLSARGAALFLVR